MQCTSPKKWGKVNKAALPNLVNNGDVDINDLSTKSINAVQAKYFRHREKKNFRCNFRDFAAAFAHETKYSGARIEQGKSSR